MFATFAEELHARYFAKHLSETHPVRIASVDFEARILCRFKNGVL